MTLTRVIIVMAAVAMPLLILLGWEGYKEAEYGGGTLPPAPDHVIHPSTEHLDHVVEAALQHEGRTALSSTVSLPYADIKKFSQHFATIAPTKGWYIHQTSRKRIHLVIPAKEIQELTAIQEDPARWVLAHETKPGMVAKGPSSRDLLKVRLDLTANDHTQMVPLIFGILAAWIIAATVAIIGGALAITEVALYIDHRRKNGHTPGENTHL